MPTDERDTLTTLDGAGGTAWRVVGDPAGLRTPTADDDALLEAAHARLPQLIAESADAARWLVTSALRDPQPALIADLAACVPALSEVFVQDELPVDAQREFLFPLVAFVAEYLRQCHGGAWVVDEVPVSPRFAVPVVQVPRGSAREQVSLHVFRDVAAFLAQPPPRDLGALVRRYRDAVAAQP